MIRDILLRDRFVKYDLQRKKVKNVNIRIKRDMSVYVSAPDRVPIKDIERILSDKSDFILSALEKYERLSESTPKREKNGNCAVVFGKELPIHSFSGKKNQAAIDEDRITLTLKDNLDTAAGEKAIDTALEKLLKTTVEDICRAVYPQYSSYCPYFPVLKFRHMKTRWGSCNYKKYILTFNYALIHAPLECIEYVIHHEFAHFIHPDHSPNFYRELSRFVPRHKELKKELEKYHSI